MITETNLIGLIEDLLRVEDLLREIPEDKGFVVYTGKNGVRLFVKELYNRDYTFRELLGLFRSGMITGHGRTYTIDTSK